MTFYRATGPSTRNGGAATMEAAALNCIRIAIWWMVALAAAVIAQPSMSAEATPKWDGDGVIEEGEDETAELARAAQNPVANMNSKPIHKNTNFNWGLGSVEETQNVLNIQPVLPFALSDDWNVITRTIFPIISQPGPIPGVFSP